MKRIRTLLVAAAGVIISLVAVAGPAGAQNEYDSNALRHKVGFWSTNLVAGSEERVIKGDATALFKARSDKAAEFYGSYRSKKTSGTVLYVLGLAGLVAGAFIVDPDDDSTDGLALGVMAGGLAVGIAGSIQLVGAQEKLNQAIWTYNRTLAVPGP